MILWCKCFFQRYGSSKGSPSLIEKPPSNHLRSSNSNQQSIKQPLEIDYCLQLDLRSLGVYWKQVCKSKSSLRKCNHNNLIEALAIQTKQPLKA